MKSNIKSDASLTDKSTIKLPKSDYLALEEQIKKVKYPTYAISQAQNLSDKILTFKNEKVIKKLQKDLQGLNSYRKVRGDGNCFFRALAFSYISSIIQPNFNNCFELIQQVNLACCQPQSIPKSFQRFYDNNFLLYILHRYWQPTYNKCLRQSKNIEKKALLKLFDQNPFLDFIVILYFRSVCLKALSKYSYELKDFITGGEQNSIRTYSQQTQGIAINLSSKIFNITIYVYEVRKQQIHSYHYDASKIRRDIPAIHLLYYENHYDIIESNENILAEQSALRKKETYYDEVSQNLKYGACMECKNVGYVNEVSGLCLKCHETSLASLHDFSKQVYRRGQCQQCQSVKDDISESFGLCRRCIQIQNQIEQQRINGSSMKRQRCAQCNRFSSQVSLQTGLCERCADTQKSYFNKIEASKRQLVQQPPPIPQYQEKSKLTDRQDGSKIGPIKIQYVQGKCTQCKLPGQIRVDHANGQVCEECISAKSKLGIKIPEKHQGPSTRSSKKIQKNCSSCNNKLDPDTSGHLCKHCESQTYSHYTCKKCNELSIQQLKKNQNGLCQKCVAKGYK